MSSPKQGPDLPEPAEEELKRPPRFRRRKDARPEELIRAAVELAWGLTDGPRIVALNTLIGALSAAAWTQKGLEVAGLEGVLTPRFGVFAPTRSVYVDLLGHVAVSGKTVLDAQFGPAVSKDPFLNFKFKGGAKGDKVTVTWVDNHGDKRTDETSIQ